MDHLPLISVITPVHNAAAYLPETIESVLAQSHTTLDYILVDDGSTDASREIIAHYAACDVRIRYHFLPHQGRPAPARNHGIDDARGAFIALVDADDIWLPDKLATQIARFHGNDRLGLVATNGKIIDENGTVGADMIGTDRIENGHVSTASLIFNGNRIATSSVLMRSDCATTCGPFNTDYRVSDDYAMWLRVSRLYEIEILEAPLIYYRRHTNNISRDRLRASEELVRILEHEIVPDTPLMNDIGQRVRRLLQRKYCSLGKRFAKSGQRDKAAENFRKSLDLRADLVVTAKTMLYTMLYR